MVWQTKITSKSHWINPSDLNKLFIVAVTFLLFHVVPCMRLSSSYAGREQQHLKLEDCRKFSFLYTLKTTTQTWRIKGSTLGRVCLLDQRWSLLWTSLFLLRDLLCFITVSKIKSLLQLQSNGKCGAAHSLEEFLYYNTYCKWLQGSTQIGDTKKSGVGQIHLYSVSMVLFCGDLKQSKSQLLICGTVLRVCFLFNAWIGILSLGELQLQAALTFGSFDSLGKIKGEQSR